MKIIKWLWAKWMPLAQKIGNFNGQVILTVFYLVLLFPLGLVYRLLTDSLLIRNAGISQKRTNFKAWEHKVETLESAKRQY